MSLFMWKVPEVGVPEIDSLLQSAVPDGIRAINICEDYLRALGAFKVTAAVLKIQNLAGH